MSKLCHFYLEVKDLNDQDSKIFTCCCGRHKGSDISVVNVDGVIREIEI